MKDTGGRQDLLVLGEIRLTVSGAGEAAEEPAGGRDDRKT